MRCRHRFYQTLDAKTAEANVLEGRAEVLRCYDIDVITLGQLFAEYVGKRGIDLLSIDIEGLDADTITTMELDIIRPRLICVEANDYEYRRRILSYLEERGYHRVVELGVNLIVEDTLE